jgi:hypothetical protein
MCFPGFLFLKLQFGSSERACLIFEPLHRLAGARLEENDLVDAQKWMAFQFIFTSRPGQVLCSNIQNDILKSVRPMRHWCQAALTFEIVRPNTTLPNMKHHSNIWNSSMATVWLFERIF